MERFIRRLKVLVSSRRLFGNWLLAGVRYCLAEHGVLKGGITANRVWAHSWIAVKRGLGRYGMVTCMKHAR